MGGVVSCATPIAFVTPRDAVAGPGRRVPPLASRSCWPDKQLRQAAATIVDATIIAVQRWTTRATKTRDPATKQR